MARGVKMAGICTTRGFWILIDFSEFLASEPLWVFSSLYKVLRWVLESSIICD